MPVPTVITDLSTTAASNYPQGSDSPATLDDVQRAHASFIRAVYDVSATALGSTGSGAIVRATSPTLTTPVLGVATATSINKLTLTAPATSATLTIANGSTFATSGAFASTFTMTGTTTVTFPTTGTLATLAGTETLTGKTLNLTSNTLSGTVAQFNTALSDGDFATLAGSETLTNKTLTTPVLGVATATTINKVTLTAPATGSTLTVADGKTLTASNTLTLAGTDSTVMTFPPATASVGYLGIPQNSQSAAYTLVLADAGKHILHPSADTTARIFTIPANASVAFPVNTAITFINQNAGGVITIAITTDTMRLAGAGTTGSRTLAANGIATAVKITTTEWIISGTGLT